MRFKSRGFAILLFITIGLIVGPSVTAEQAESEMTPEEQAAALKAKQQQAEIRKILSSEPDPSLMLEPIPDPPEDKRKKVPPKPERPVPPAERAMASQPGQPLGLGGNLGPGPNGGATGGAPAGAVPGVVGGNPVTAGALNPLAFSPSSGGAGNKLALKMGRLHGEAPPSPEIAVILHNKQFFPSRIRIKAGIPTKVYFTTTAERPAAIVVEQLQVQKWLAKESQGSDRKPASSEYDRAKFEVTREVAANKMTEITFEPRRGTYSFHDAISGAKGQIVCE